jgi:hypothetical protein
MTVLTAYDFIPGASLYTNGDLVCLRRAWQEERGFHTQEFTAQVLQGIYRWVLTALIIPDWGFVDGIAHRIRWPCRGIRGEVNHVRILPSCECV